MSAIGLKNRPSARMNRNYLASSTGLFPACAIGSTAAQAVGPTADYKIKPEYTSTSPDGTTTVEQYAKIDAKGDYTWQFWTRHLDKLTLLEPEQADYPAGFRLPTILNGSCECKKPALDTPACIYTTWVRRDLWAQPGSRSATWHGPTSRAFPIPERSGGRLSISNPIS